MDKNFVTAELAKQIRINSLQMVHRVNASHIGGALSVADILAVLYNDILNIDPAYPDRPNRDRLLLSKGHACTALYSVLALKGFFPIAELENYSKNGSTLLSHTNHHVAGVELSSGSLGHALSISCGLAIAAKRMNLSWRTFCLLSDGELDEGSNWEAFLFAPQHSLDNLIVIIDYNKIQSLGNVKDVIDLEPLRDKFDAFRWEVFEVDGHNQNDLIATFNKATTLNKKPKVIISHTIKGKGVSFMENKLLWHYKSPDVDQFEKAIDELIHS